MAHPPASSPENVPENVPPVFETSRLRLRPWRDTDAPGPDEGPDGDSLRFMPAGATSDTATPDTATSEAMLGNVQIFAMGPIHDRFQGELGYWLRPGTRGRGVIDEALEPVIAHAFTPIEDGGLGLTRLHAATDSDNYASQSILRSAGFNLCGTDHQAWRGSDGSLSDGMYFELLAFELPAGTDRPAIAQEAVEPITLEGNGVLLREWRHTDAGRVVEACSDERTQHWLGGMPSPYTLRDAHAYIAGRSEQASEGKGCTGAWLTPGATCASARSQSWVCAAPWALWVRSATGPIQMRGVAA